MWRHPSFAIEGGPVVGLAWRLSRTAIAVGPPAGYRVRRRRPVQPISRIRSPSEPSPSSQSLLVYFAGHGRTGSRNELWLCLPDTDPDELPYTAWPYDELRRMVAESRATKKVVILDCCFSGRALADQAGDEETILGQVAIEDTYLLTATAANAVALAPPGERYTAITDLLSHEMSAPRLAGVGIILSPVCGRLAERPEARADFF